MSTKEQIISMYNEGKNTTEITKDLNVSVQYVNRIIKQLKTENITNESLITTISNKGIHIIEAYNLLIVNGTIHKLNCFVETSNETTTETTTETSNETTTETTTETSKVEPIEDMLDMLINETEDEHIENEPIEKVVDYFNDYFNEPIEDEPIEDEPIEDEPIEDEPIVEVSVKKSKKQMYYEMLQDFITSNNIPIILTDAMVDLMYEKKYELYGRTKEDIKRALRAARTDTRS